MSDYKLVPVEPTPEMIEAAREHHEGDAYLPVSLYRAMLAAAPAVQGEPEPCQECGGDGAGGEHEEDCAMVRPAEQQPAPDVEALVEALEKYESAFDELFAQCCSNPITNAWGKPVSVAALNDAHAFASSRLAAHRKQGGEV